MVQLKLAIWEVLFSEALLALEEINCLLEQKLAATSEMV